MIPDYVCVYGAHKNPCTSKHTVLYYYSMMYRSFIITFLCFTVFTFVQPVSKIKFRLWSTDFFIRNIRHQSRNLSLRRKSKPSPYFTSVPAIPPDLSQLHSSLHISLRIYECTYVRRVVERQQKPLSKAIQANKTILRGSFSSSRPLQLQLWLLLFWFQFLYYTRTEHGEQTPFPLTE